MLLRDILDGDDLQISAVVRILRTTDADAVILAGIDHDLEGHAITALANLVGDYPHRFTAPPNRGVASGSDRDGDGRFGEPEDAYGHAAFRGQGGMAILSRFPIQSSDVQDYTSLSWRDLRGNLAPEDTATDHPLSTTAHWIVPLRLPDGTNLHLGTWHATPPVFDGPEDRNGRRNHDEAAFWLRWLDGEWGDVPEMLVLAGAANLDIVDGDGLPGALKALLSHPKLNDPAPRSTGAVQAADIQGGVNAMQEGDAALDTADWNDASDRPGNLRVDYVLPSKSLHVVDAGVFWPQESEPYAEEVTHASRHRLVWVDFCLFDDQACLVLGRAEPGKMPIIRRPSGPPALTP